VAHKESLLFTTLYLIMTTTKSKSATKTVVAIVHAGHGVSYASGTEQEIIIATRACKEAKRTWSKMYKFPKETVLVAGIFDISNTERWNYNDDSGLMTDQDGKTLPVINSYQVVV